MARRFDPALIERARRDARRLRTVMEVLNIPLGVVTVDLDITRASVVRGWLEDCDDPEGKRYPRGQPKVRLGKYLVEKEYLIRDLEKPKKKEHAVDLDKSVTKELSRKGEPADRAGKRRLGIPEQLTLPDQTQPSTKDPAMEEGWVSTEVTPLGPIMVLAKHTLIELDLDNISLVEIVKLQDALEAARMRMVTRMGGA